jgi:dGTPase
VRRYVKDIQLVKRQPKSPVVAVDAKSQRKMAMLKELVWVDVSHRPALGTQQVGQRAVIPSLFERFYRAAVKNEWQIFPVRHREQLEAARKAGREEAERRRSIADLISGMTERQAIHLHSRFTGMALGSVSDHLPT